VEKEKAIEQLKNQIGKIEKERSDTKQAYVRSLPQMETFLTKGHLYCMQDYLALPRAACSNSEASYCNRCDGKGVEASVVSCIVKMNGRGSISSTSNQGWGYNSYNQGQGYNSYNQGSSAYNQVRY
jgi:hypothetical protein